MVVFGSLKFPDNIVVDEDDEDVVDDIDDNDGI